MVAMHCTAFRVAHAAGDVGLGGGERRGPAGYPGNRSRRRTAYRRRARSAMFQFDFGGITSASAPVPTSAIDATAVARVAVTYWEEHCLECARPQCYRTCPLFVRRSDTNCARFAAGIARHDGFRGLFPHAAEIRFRKWGKLQTTIGGGSLRVADCRRLQRIDTRLGRTTTHADIAPARFRDVRLLKPQTWYNKARTMLVDRNAVAGPPFRPDELLIEAWSLGPEPFRLCVEVQLDAGVLHRESLPFVPGHNLARSTAIVARLPPPGMPGRLLVYPENDHEAHLAFTWLDLVRWKTTGSPSVTGTRGHAPRRAGPPGAASLAPAATVKCVVWDLDETLWHGIVGDDGPTAVRPREECLRLVRDLDARGILQSVASKNDPDLAWGVVRRAGLAEFFLHPQIGWSAKSTSVRRIAEALGIGIDTLAVIDDSAFERAEIASALPAVRTYDAAEVAGLLDRPEFDVPVTTEARGRRALYQAEARRSAARAEEGSDPTEFLRGCGLVLRVGERFDEESLDRCHELLQRTNQLNLSGRRLERGALAAGLADTATCCRHLRCIDRFGDYGLIGFIALRHEADALVITDLVLSCRVAAKKVEHALAAHLQRMARDRGARRIVANHVPMPRNGVLLAALQAAGFVATPDDPRPTLDVAAVVPDADVVRVEVAG